MDEDSKYDLVLAESTFTGAINSDWKERLSRYDELSEDDWRPFMDEWERMRKKK